LCGGCERRLLPARRSRRSRCCRRWSGRGRSSLGRLAALEGIRPPAASRLVDSLERAGLAARAGAVGRDRRVVLVEATERGRRLLGERRHGLDAHLAGRLALFSPAERALLAAAVDLLERLLEEKE